MIQGYVISDRGIVRERNEDNYLLGHCLNENQDAHMESNFLEHGAVWTCAGVFDGMGGVEGGEIASYLATNIFQEDTIALEAECEEGIDELIENAFRRANDAIVQTRDRQNIGGTTASVVVTNGKKLKVYHRGDSRVYLKKKNLLYILSEDHTLAQLKLDVGIYHDKKEAQEKEFHQLTDYLGMEKSLELEKPYESSWIELESEDIILICSDGLYDMCSDEIILTTLALDEDLKSMAVELLRKALANGGQDNTTILLIKAE